MKKYFLIVFLFFAGNCLAQDPSNSVRLVQYVFDSFQPATIIIKSGKTYEQNLNYNIITNEMVFEQDGKFSAMATPEMVDTVYIADRKFIPLNNKFYEVLAGGKKPLLYESSASVSEPGVSVGYGSTTTTSAATSYQSLLRDGSAYKLKLPDGYNVIPKHEFYILVDGKLEKAGSVKRLSKIFPDQSDAIKKIAKINKTDFSNREEVAKLVSQLEQ